jgi:hypothetical protein
MTVSTTTAESGFFTPQATTGRGSDSTAPVSSPYNTHRRHRALRQQPAIPKPIPIRTPPAEARGGRRDRLGGLLHEYELAA